MIPNTKDKGADITNTKNTANLHIKLQYFQLALLCISLFTVVFLITKNFELSQKFNGLETLNKDLLNSIKNETRNEITTLFDNISSQTQNELTIKMQELKNITLTNFNNSLTCLSTELKSSINNANDNLANLTKKLSCSIDNTIELANSRIIRNEKNADIALEMAKIYLEFDNYEMAKIYLINAINHNPQKIKYVSQLFKLFQKHYSSNENILDQVRSIIELSLYQLEPQYIEQNLKYLSKLDDANQKIILASQDAIEEKEIDWVAEYNLILNDDLNEISTNPEKLQGRLNKLTKILSNIETNEANFEKLIILVREEIHKEQIIYSLSKVTQEINNYLDLLAEEEDYSSQSATARLLSASKSMSVFWSYDINETPPKLRNLIVRKLPDSIELYKQKINKAKSLPYYDEAVQIIVKALDYNDVKYQIILDHNRQYSEKAVIVSQNITDPNMLNDIHEKLKQLQKNDIKLQRKQYIAYQRWASNVCSEIFREIDSMTFFNDDDAIRIFNQSDINMIDLRLTSPEVSQVYNKMVQKIVGELPSKDAFSIQRELMLSQKKSLGDF